MFFFVVVFCLCVVFLSEGQVRSLIGRIFPGTLLKEARFKHLNLIIWEVNIGIEKKDN